MEIDISKLHTDTINFNIDTFDETNNAEFILNEKLDTNLTGKSIKGKVIQLFKGGKSGDSPMLIEQNGKKYVLKLFFDHITAKSTNEKIKTATQTAEIIRHIEFINLFKNEYVPCPYIYCHGVIYINNTHSLRKYYIMEYVEGPELHDYIFKICEDNTHLLSNVNMKNIMLELFYYICKMIINGITHCDLHAKNIIIVKNKNSSINFGTLLQNGKKHNLLDYRIKILDFGLAVKDKSCAKKRALSSSIVDLRKKCRGSTSSALMQLIKGESPLSYNGNTDLLFFCNILKAIKTSKKTSLNYEWVNKIDISLIRDIIDYIEIKKDNSDTKTHLNAIYQELTKSAKNANASRKRIKLCIKERKTNGNSKTLKYTRSNNNSKNRNKTCKYYNRTVNPNSGAITIQTIK